MLKYYVYAYLRENSTPYYIGRGTGRRAWNKGSGEVSPPQNMSRIIIVEDNLSNVGSLAIERQLIRWYGRKDLGSGILRNKTDGGDGVANGPSKSGANNSFYGKKHSTESREKIRQGNFNKSHTDKMKCGDVHRGRPWSVARRLAYELRKISNVQA